MYPEAMRMKISLRVNYLKVIERLGQKYGIGL